MKYDDFIKSFTVDFDLSDYMASVFKKGWTPSHIIIHRPSNQIKVNLEAWMNENMAGKWCHKFVNRRTTNASNILSVYEFEYEEDAISFILMFE